MPRRIYQWVAIVLPILFLLTLCLLFRTGPSKGSDPVAGAENQPNLLEIYFPQNGPKLDDKEKFTPGSFTLVNMNDTDGDAKIDSDQETPTLVKSVLAVQKANVINIDPQNLKFFPDFVFSAFNRLRVKQGNIKGELVTILISGANGDITIVERPPFVDVYEGKEVRAEIGEVDLVRVLVNAPQIPIKDVNAVTVKVLNGLKFIRVWETENRENEIKLDNGTLVLPYKGPKDPAFPKPLWIEAKIPLPAKNAEPSDLSIRQTVNQIQKEGGIVLEARYGNYVPQKVRITPVWAYRSNFWTKAKTTPTGKTLNGDATGNILTGFQDNAGGDLGMGVWTMIGRQMRLEFLVIGGREQSEYTLLPEKIGGQKYVVPAFSRQAAFRAIFVTKGNVEEFRAMDFPERVGNPWENWNWAEVDTDVTNHPDNPKQDRDNSKTNDHIYGIDGPSVDFTRLFLSNADFVAYRVTLKDYVRFKFGIDPRTKNVQVFTKGGLREPMNTIEGSRGSKLDDWHMILYAKRGKGKDVKAVDAYVFDNDDVSSSFPQPKPGINGDGVAKDFPTTSANAITEGWTAKFMNNQFELEGTVSKIQGTSKLTGNEYKITATNGFVEFVILKGDKKGFENGDEFSFSTFKAKAPPLGTWPLLVLVKDSTANGTASVPEVKPNAKTESWTATFMNGKFDLVGSVSGNQGQFPATGAIWTLESKGNSVKVIVSTGSQPFKNGDKFTFRTGRKINDIAPGFIDIKTETP